MSLGSSLGEDFNSPYLRKAAREYYEKYPSMRKMAFRMVSRRGGSPATLNSYYQGVKRFIEFLKEESPETALEKIKAGRIDVRKTLDEEGVGYIDSLRTIPRPKIGRKRGGVLSASTIHSDVAAVKKWLVVNEAKVDLNGLEMPSTSQTVESDRAPTKDELGRMLNVATLRDKTILLTLATSGLRIGTLLSLNWGDIDFNYPDLARISVKREGGRKFTLKGSRNSNSNLYMTWVTPEAKALLLQYKAFRENKGETITAESPLFSGEEKRVNMKHENLKQLSLSGFQHVYHTILKKTGLNQRGNHDYELHLHTLRKFFRSMCVGVDPSYREKWMGHSGGYLDPSYFRAEEPKHLNEYRKALPHLSLNAVPANENELRKRMILDFARAQGVSEERLMQMSDIIKRTKTVDDAIDEIRKLGEASKIEHKLVESTEDMLQMLRKGWEIERELNGGGKFLLRRQVLE